MVQIYWWIWCRLGSEKQQSDLSPGFGVELCPEMGKVVGKASGERQQNMCLKRSLRLS